MMKSCKCGTSKFVWALVIVGGLVWGLVGVGMLMQQNWDVVNLVLGKWPTVEAIVYIAVGVATIASLFGCKCSKCKECMAGSATGAQM